MSRITPGKIADLRARMNESTWDGHWCCRSVCIDAIDALESAYAELDALKSQLDERELITGETNVVVHLRIVDKFDDDVDTIARIYYPDEGNWIGVVRGLSRAEVERAIAHEIGHLVDWYMGEQAKDISTREHNADTIADALLEERRVVVPTPHAVDLALECRNESRAKKGLLPIQAQQARGEG